MSDNAEQVIAIPAEPVTLRLVSPTGGVLTVTYRRGPGGQAELDVHGEGDASVWVQQDLVLGGEEAEGYDSE